MKPDRAVEGWYGRCGARHLADPASLPYVDLLARRALAGDGDALEELAGCLGGIAEAVAARYAGAAIARNVERDDTRQEAMAAMLAGLKTWRPEKSAFRSYAFNLARFAVLNLINRSLALSASAPVVDRVYRGEPGNRKTSAAAYRNVASALKGVGSLDAATEADGEEAHRHETWAGFRERGYEEVLTSLALSQIFRKASSQLTEREREAVLRRFPLDGSEQPTLRAIGEEMGIVQERVRQCVLAGLKKLGRVA